jgi:hypothetical protein
MRGIRRCDAPRVYQSVTAAVMHRGSISQSPSASAAAACTTAESLFRMLLGVGLVVCVCCVCALLTRLSATHLPPP